MCLGGWAGVRPRKGTQTWLFSLHKESQTKSEAEGAPLRRGREGQTPHFLENAEAASDRDLGGTVLNRWRQALS